MTERIMSLIGWLFFGLIAGFIASKIVNQRGSGCAVNIALGIAGAVVGGAMFSFLGTPVWMEFSFKSMIVAVIGAILVLLVFHALAGRRR
jgi:uncharacterized membrane protein YeaQ/YmgE (transglycosylase-associated protein family)